MRNISLSGLAGSGKDTLAAILIENFGYKRVAFADELKRIASEYFSWDGEKDDKGRTLLQLLGTEIGRSFYQNLWLCKLSKVAGFDSSLRLPDADQTLEDKMKYIELYYNASSSNELKKARLVALLEFGWNGIHTPHVEEVFHQMTKMAMDYSNDWSKALPDKEFYVKKCKAIYDVKKANAINSNIVVTDTRFPNEAEFLRDNGFYLAVVNRPGTISMGHASETSLKGYQFDKQVDNNGTLSDLIDRVFTELLPILS